VISAIQKLIQLKAVLPLGADRSYEAFYGEVEACQRNSYFVSSEYEFGDFNAEAR